MAQLLPWRPKPYDDEILSSWLRRVAYGNSSKLHTFCHLKWPGLQIWNRDLDSLGSRSFINDLCVMTGTAENRGHATSLRSLEGIVFDRLRLTGLTRWILPLGIYHRTRRRSGQQWCPSCLKEGKAPYYRRAWRLGFSTTCSSHGYVLADRCHQCALPASPHRGEDPYCSHCFTDRRDHPTMFGDALTLQLEHRMRATWLGPPSAMPELGCGHPLSYFALVRQILSIVTSNPRASRLRDVVCREHGLDPAPPIFESKLPMPEFLPVIERHRMMAIVARLLQGWPFKFAALCAEAGMWRSWAIRGNSGVLPFAYDAVIDTYLTSPDAPHRKLKPVRLSATSQGYP